MSRRTLTPLDGLCKTVSFPQWADDIPLDVSDNLEGGLLDVVHVLAMGVLPKLLGGANDDVDTIDSCVASKLGILDGLLKKSCSRDKTC